MDIELEDVGAPFLGNTKQTEAADFGRLAQRSVADSYSVEFEGCDVAVDSLDWRNSVLLRLQVLAGFCNFVLFGLADQTIGTVIPVLEDYYEMDDMRTGFIFLAQTAGYFVMALATELCHRRLGVRGVGVLGALSMALAYLVIHQRPPYSVFVAAYFISGLGFGSLDASFNGWMSNLVDLNQLLGILHGCYGIGCMISPPLVTRLLEKETNPWAWNDYYLVLSSIAAVCTVYFGVVFRHETPAKYRFMVLMNEARKAREVSWDEVSDIESLDTSTTEASGLEDLAASADPPEPKEFAADLVPLSVALGSKQVWLFSLLMFIYVGAESAFGTWLVTFLTRINGLSYKLLSYMATTFWMGLTLGRIFLGFVTAHYFRNEFNANWCYMALSLLGHVMFCIVVLTPYTWPLFPIVLFLGLFVGPIFPTNIVAAIRVLPVKFHASGVGFICAFGGGGAAAVPFLVGLIAEASDLGLRFFPTTVALLYLGLLVFWTVVRSKYIPKLPPSS
ncbi:MFS general substrate transporter [Metschnikowia bicuspidata var. bicuspidata NRRL YB-4993]|uniref:MFS general substrate transporter n=1 Tax=Metschnikowia bicuspidata var. bicuspidata NRRL YB-4993 TaxID=869754 RepID=A0A1A0HHV6_9ASCO|nr:MFS general substrate transporter [Metschnikowia bicuspidata var. bicuspidata NRRL YB-4993]OBA23744.1 MFS general substrate transporter [Metschnikowia bicuspidata var. bicuspidata NRRL YB-4993]